MEVKREDSTKPGRVSWFQRHRTIDYLNNRARSLKVTEFRPLPLVTLCEWFQSWVSIFHFEILWNQIISKWLPGLKYVLNGVMLVSNIFENESVLLKLLQENRVWEICMRNFIRDTCKIISTGEEVIEVGFSEWPKCCMIKIKVTTNYTESSELGWPCSTVLSWARMVRCHSHWMDAQWPLTMTFSCRQEKTAVWHLHSQELGEWVLHPWKGVGGDSGNTLRHNTTETIQFNSLLIPKINNHCHVLSKLLPLAMQ